MARGNGPAVGAEPGGAATDTAPEVDQTSTAARLRTAAREVFAEQGWRATRVQDIVRRTGVSHGTFYTYYGNKAAVLEALIDEVEADFFALGRRSWHAEDVRGALERVIGGFLDHYRRHAAVINTWLSAGREQSAFARRYRHARAVFVQRVAEHLAATAAASERDSGQVSPQAVATTLVSMVEHVAWSWMTLGEPDDREEVLASLVLVWGAALNELAGFRVVEP